MKDFRVRRMFEDIAFSYDLQNSVLSLRRDSAWRRLMARLLGPGPDRLVLDAATGTAEVALELLRLGAAGRVIGLDFSPAMLDKARLKARARGLADRLSLGVADCRRLPLASESVDAAAIAFGIRNIEERGAVLAEFCRVLKPGGRLLVAEFGYPDVPVLGPLYRFYFTRILPPLGNFLSRTDYAYDYLVESVNAFPDDATFLGEMAAAGFGRLRVEKPTFGVARIYLGDKMPTG